MGAFVVRYLDAGFRHCCFPFNKLIKKAPQDGRLHEICAHELNHFIDFLLFCFLERTGPGNEFPSVKAPPSYSTRLPQFQY